MSFFKQLSSAVTDMVRKVTEPSSPYEVQEIKTQNTKRWTEICVEENITLLKDGSYYVTIIQDTTNQSRAFSLFQLSNETEAMTTFSNLSYKLVVLYHSCGGALFKKEILQALVDAVRSNPTWTAAHLAAHVGLEQCFKHNVLSKQLNTMDEVTRVTPIQLAIQAEHMKCITELIILNAQLNIADADGNNVFHYAAKAKDSKIIQYLASKDPSSINQLNVFGESPLHVACLNDRPDNVECLLRWGCDPNKSMSGRFPMHCAMKVSSAKCAERLCHWSREQIHIRDTKYGGSPLHWCKNKECVYLLTDMGCNIDGTNSNGETPLHIMTQRDRLDCVMALLTKAADAACRGCHDNTVLHMAIQADSPELLQALIVFGADVNGVNKYNISVRHMAATHGGSNKLTIVQLLHRVGALRCPPTATGCTEGCSASAVMHDTASQHHVTTPEHERKDYDKMVTDIAMTAALTRSASASGSNILCGDNLDGGQRSPMGSAGDRLLCLDGGGIRGMVLIQILLALEKASGQPIRNCFDWIGGTSTGGILALAIVHSKSLRYCQGLYFRLKDQVFNGKRPYDTEPFERFLKKEFGENTRMSEREYPRVLVTTVIGDVMPAKLHIFRNYDIPCPEYGHKAPLNTSLPRPNEQFVWKAARSTGAAPTYFRAFERYLDGGLISNNPTLDVMTEVHEHNMGLNAIGQGQMIRPMHVVVSLGTGCIPTRANSNMADAYVPSGILDIYNAAMGAMNLGELLVDQATMSEGRPVERARAWCSMIGVPYFRFSPQLSQDVKLDCKDDKMLINMLWETQCYLHEHQERLVQVAALLWP